MPDNDGPLVGVEIMEQVRQPNLSSSPVRVGHRGQNHTAGEQATLVEFSLSPFVPIAPLYRGATAACVGTCENRRVRGGTRRDEEG